MSAVTAIASLRNLRRIPNKLFVRLGPAIKMLFKETLSNFADESNTCTHRICPGFCGWYTLLRMVHSEDWEIPTFFIGFQRRCYLGMPIVKIPYIKATKCCFLTGSFLRLTSNDLALLMAKALLLVNLGLGERNGSRASQFPVSFFLNSSSMSLRN